MRSERGEIIYTCVYGMDKTITTVTGRQTHVVSKAFHRMTVLHCHCQSGIIAVIDSTNNSIKSLAFMSRKIYNIRDMKGGLLWTKVIRS